MVSEQIAVRLPADLMRELDNLVEQCGYRSRAAAVRAGVEELAARERRRQVDQSIVEGYRRTPPTDAEHQAAKAAAAASIAEEPW